MQQNQNAHSEIIGGFQNALEHGETLNQARQTFLAAGYSPQEVQNAYVQMTRINPVAAANPNQPIPKVQNQPKVQGQNPKSKSHKTLYIVTAIICVLLIAGTLVIGLFWDRLFG